MKEIHQHSWFPFNRRGLNSIIIFLKINDFLLVISQPQGQIWVTDEDAALLNRRPSVRKPRNEICINPFVPNAPFLYPLKTSENLSVFWCFQGVEKGCLGNEWVKPYLFWTVVPNRLLYLLHHILVKSNYVWQKQLKWFYKIRVHWLTELGNAKCIPPPLCFIYLIWSLLKFTLLVIFYNLSD